MNFTVHSANNYRQYYMHLIVLYGNGGNKLFVICNVYFVYCHISQWAELMRMLLLSNV